MKFHPPVRKVLHLSSLIKSTTCAVQIICNFIFRGRVHFNCFSQRSSIGINRVEANIILHKAIETFDFNFVFKIAFRDILVR